MSRDGVLFGWHCSLESFQPEELLAQASAAEAAGFDLVLASDHFHPWVADVGASGFVWSWLGAAAALTKRVQLITNVTCPLFHYHPGVIAQAAATIERLSGGRFILGVGTGENLNEGPLGFEFPSHRVRLARMDEALTLIQSLLAGEKVSFAGEFFRTDRAQLYSPPRNTVPVFLAAGGPRTARLAASTDGLITAIRDPDVAATRTVNPYLDATHARRPSSNQGSSQSVTSDMSVLLNRWCVVAKNPDDAWRAIAPIRGLWAPHRLSAVDPADLQRTSDRLGPEAILSQFSVVRSVDEMVDVYTPLITDLGATHLSFQIASLDPLATIDAIGQRVLPKLRELTPRRTWP